MALNKLKFNSLNVTPAASEGIRFNSGANGLETASAGGSLVKIASTTASSSSSISFTSGIDSTYKEYIFFFNNIHPASDGANFQFQASTNGGSSYGVTLTTTSFRSYHDEADNNTGLIYEETFDLAQSTSYQDINREVGGDNDQCQSSILHLFDPSNTTFVKHFLSNGSRIQQNDFNSNNFVAGYFNTTSAINALDFKMSSGNIDSGTITMYGVN